MTKIVGITGGISSGKSTLSSYLIKNNYKVHDSDQEVSNIYKKNPTKLKNFLREIGLKKAIREKKINKKIIAEEIFKNKNIKIKLEKHLHLEVRKKRNLFIKKNKQKKEKLIFLDIPLLFENNLDYLCDKIICVISTKKNRLNRFKKKKKIPQKTFKNIVKNQTTDKERRHRSDYLITNNDSKKNFIKRARGIVEDLLS